MTRNNVTVFESVKREQTPSIIDMSEYNRSFGIKITGPEQVLKQIQVSLDMLIQVNGSIKESRQRKTIKLRPCILDDFVDNQGNDVSLQDNLSNINLTAYYCPESLVGIQLGGAFSEDNFQYLRFQIHFCNDCDSQTLTNVINYFENNEKIQINLIYINYVINSQNAHNPFKSFIDKHIYYSLNPVYESIESSVYFRQYYIYDYYSLFDQTTHSTQILLYNEFTDAESQKNFQNKYLNFLSSGTLAGSKSTICAQIYLKRSEYTVESDRLFETIGEALSYIGGLMQFALVFFSFIFTTYNRYSFIKTLANACYSYVVQEQVSELQSQILLQEEKQSKEYLIQQSQNIMTHITSRFKINLSHFFLSLIATTNKYLEQRRKLQVAIEIVSRDIDFFRLVKVMHDVERLKAIVLTQEQLNIFNKLPKPNISIYNNIRSNGIVDNLKEQLAEIENLNDFALVDPPIFRQMFDSLEQHPRYFENKQRLRQAIDHDNNAEIIRYVDKIRDQVSDEEDFFNSKIDQLITFPTKNILAIISQNQHVQDQREQLFPLYISFPQINQNFEQPIVYREVFLKSGAKETIATLGRQQLLRHFFPNYKNIQFNHKIISILLTRQNLKGNVEIILTNQTNNNINNFLIQISPLIKHQCNPLPTYFSAGQRLKILAHVQRSQMPINMKPEIYPKIIEDSDINDYQEEIISLMPTILISFEQREKINKIQFKIPDWYVQISSSIENYQTKESLTVMFIYNLSPDQQPSLVFRQVIPDFVFGNIYQLEQVSALQSMNILLKIENEENQLIFSFDQDCSTDKGDFQREIAYILLSLLID